ncbi:MAG: hypothetical protein K0U93_24875, partial [Gammaproteobacteria bacterium]|nr:hypothetical protein [Gammaproteobacteria bacterium]
MSDRAYTFVAVALVIFSATGLFHLFNVVVDLHSFYPSAAPLSLAGAMAFSALFTSIRYADLSKSLSVFVRGIVLIAGVYSLLTYPAYPIVQNDFWGYGREIVVGAWALAVFAAL